MERLHLGVPGVTLLGYVYFCQLFSLLGFGYEELDQSLSHQNVFGPRLMKALPCMALGLVSAIDILSYWKGNVGLKEEAPFTLTDDTSVYDCTVPRVSVLVFVVFIAFIRRPTSSSVISFSRTSPYPEMMSVSKTDLPRRSFWAEEAFCFRYLGIGVVEHRRSLFDSLPSCQQLH